MTFKTCTRAMPLRLKGVLREQILEAPLPPLQAEFFNIPLDQWRTADREQFDGYRCSIANSTAPGHLTPLDASDPILSKMSLFKGPVTKLQLDAIVNAANETCLGGGGVDGAIHAAAGPLLLRECATHNGCFTGEALITKGYLLPARFVIHTVGPIGEKPDLLRSCYQSVLSLASVNNLRTIGLCGISTGVYGYPLGAATRIAVEEVAAFLKANASSLDMVAFACFTDAEAEALMTEVARLKTSSLA